MGGSFKSAQPIQSLTLVPSTQHFLFLYTVQEGQTASFNYPMAELVKRPFRLLPEARLVRAKNNSCILFCRGKNSSVSWQSSDTESTDWICQRSKPTVPTHLFKKWLYCMSFGWLQWQITVPFLRHRWNLYNQKSPLLLPFYQLRK